MSQQPNPTEASVTASVHASLTPIVGSLNNLMQEVRELPSGGDLEGLIEVHLAGLERQCLDLALGQRQQAAEQKASEKPEAFPPSGLPQVSGAVAPGTPQAANDPDSPR